MNSMIWGHPARHQHRNWAVVDVETSGFQPGQARVISVAVLGLDASGAVQESVVSLLNPGVDPGPTHVHGLTSAMLEGQPQFADIVWDVCEVLRGRTLVAHNVGFDYSFLAAEAELAGAELPIDSAMCTVELTRRLRLDIDNLRLGTLAAYWGVSQTRPHDAYDDAMVLTGVLEMALKLADERDVWLPIRPVTRRRWPNGRVTHEELQPLKTLAARIPCEYRNPGRYVPGQPLIQGMRIALAAELERTPDELIERILHAGLAYADAVDGDTSLLLCRQGQPEQSKVYLAEQLGVPVLSDEQFLDHLGAVVEGEGVQDFPPAVTDDQLALF